jgi:amino acid transporter
MLQYISKYVPHIYNGKSLTTLGVLFGVAIMAVFLLVNWFGVQLFARVNGALTVAKFMVPTLTVILQFISGFHRDNFSSADGFAPYGWAPGLSAIATAGIIYAYQQWRGGVDWLDVRVGARLVAYLVAILVMSYIGSSDFGGTNLIPAPWDSVIVAVLSFVAYLRGVPDAVRHLAVHPAPEPAREPDTAARAS